MWRVRFQAALAQHFERGRRSVLKEMTVDVKQALAVFTLEDVMLAPDLVE
ncbi:hypothetical protein PAMC26577_25940 [Caballeronia sordidicola]|uniref:Uncharacterized protein n=1 Tax=Caballeronia sordidicola TaxID=196367 RepID=A0A242MH65_CABSO|nr:hypothetical protein PAMC26577_25940 [Caballeronia sordidicola]